MLEHEIEKGGAVKSQLREAHTEILRLRAESKNYQN